MADQVTVAKKKTARRERDDYQTPPAIVEPLLELVDWSRVRSFREPCRGDGNIYRPVHAALENAAASEAAPRSRLLDWCELRDGRDYFRPCFPVDLIITNPPFTLAARFLEKSLDEAATVIYLLPLQFLASGERQSFWRTNPPTNLIAISSRPCFVWVCSKKECKGSADPKDAPAGCPACGARMKRQTDLADVGWYVWDRGRMLTTRAPFLWI